MFESSIKRPGPLLDSANLVPDAWDYRKNPTQIPAAKARPFDEILSGQLQETILELLKFYMPLPGDSTINGGMQPSADTAKQMDESRDVHASPEMQQAREIAAAGGGLSGHTTVMIQQIPFEYTQKKLMHEINRGGFEGTFDFFYLPVNARNRGSRGFGFVNFLTASAAEAFYLRYQGQKLKHYEASTTLSVVPADVQGFEQSAAAFFASWHLRKKKRHSEPVFLKPVPSYLREEGLQKRILRRPDTDEDLHEAKTALKCSVSGLQSLPECSCHSCPSCICRIRSL